MARVPYLQDDQLVEPAATLVAGHPIALYRGLAHSPAGLESFAKVGSWIRYGSKLDPRLREMTILAVGVLAGCKYEFSHHVKIARDFGVDDGDIEGVLAAMRGEGFKWSGVEEQLMVAVREIVLDGKIGDATWKSLSESFEDELMVEIVMIIAHYCCVVRVLDSIGIDVEPAYQRYLEEFPLQR